MSKRLVSSWSAELLQPGEKTMSLEDMMSNVDGTYFTMSEYDTLCVAALNGGLIELPEDPDDPTDEVPEALTEWIAFCEYIRSANAILHLVLNGILVPLNEDDEDDYPGYRYEKSEMADAIIDNMGVGAL